MLTNEIIRLQAEAQQDYVIESRRTIHRFAEVSGKEFKTSAFIEEEIKKAGLPYEKAGDTGWIAILDTGKPGSRIALRADIDALLVPEEPNNLAGPRVVVSDDPHTSHACGHDAHTAMLLGAMRVLAEQRDNLAGVIYFCFEEGEEDGRGILAMLNPVFCAASILTNTATAWVNQITAGRTVTLGVTSIQGGEAPNVIPDTADILGSLRFFNDEEGEKAVRIFKNVAEHTAAMNNCQVQFDDRFCVLCAPVINDEYYSNLISAALPEVLLENVTVSSCEPWYASESFSCYRRICPSVLAHLGINNPSYGSGAAHHNGFFDVDEGVLSTGVIATLKFVAMLQK